MILTDKEAIKQFKRNATFHKYNLWLDDKHQKMMIKVKANPFSSKMVVHDYNDVSLGTSIQREPKSVYKSRQFRNSLIGGIFGGGLGSVIGAMYGANHPQKIDYYVNPGVRIYYNDLSVLMVTVYHGRIRSNSILAGLVDKELDQLVAQIDRSLKTDA